MRHWLFLRHFEKEEHPLAGLRDEVRSLQHPALWYQALLCRWDLLDEKRALSEDGRLHGMRTREKLPQLLEEHGVNVSRVMRSRYRRVAETAAILESCWPHAQHKIDDRLNEMRPGLHAYFSYDEIASIFPQYRLAVDQLGYLNVPWPGGGDSHRDRRDRDVEPFIEELKALEGDVAVLTHAGVIDCVHQLVLGLSDDEVLARFGPGRRPPCGGATIVRYDPEKDSCTLICENTLASEPAS